MLVVLKQKRHVPSYFYELFLVGVCNQIWSQSCCGLQFVCCCFFYNLLIVVVDSLFGVYKQTQSLKPMHHSFLIHNPDIPLCLTKVTDEFTGLENINNFISYSLKSQCLLERRLYITFNDCILHTSWGLTTVTCGLVSCPHKAFLAALSCPSNSIGLRGIYGLFHILSDFFKLFGLLF